MLKQPNSQAWWNRTNKETLDDRVRATQNVNDPTIVADDVQRKSKGALLILLAFTTLLSSASYFKFFEKSFGFWIAIVMALILAGVIEFGKNYGLLRVLRIPFFLGWKHIWVEVQNTIMWVFLLLLSIVTFLASVYNSTHGAQQLSLLLSHERTYRAFTPNTTDIDAQIANLQKEDSNLGNIRRKSGKTNWAIQPMKEQNAKTLLSLQQQRETLIAQQRADWEKQDAFQSQQNQFSANSLLAVGGWVELLQVILLFVRVSAERSLDKTASQRRQSIPYPTTGNNGQPPIYNQQQVHNTGMGFFWPGYGQPKDALEKQPMWHNENTVAQPPQTVPQQNGQKPMSYADSVIEICRQAIQRDMSNFNNRQAKPETVAKRIHDALETCYNALKERDFAPTYATGLRLYTYLQETVFPLLNVIGQPYANQVFFTERLYHAFKPQEYTQ